MDPKNKNNKYTIRTTWEAKNKRKNKKKPKSKGRDNITKWVLCPPYKRTRKWLSLLSAHPACEVDLGPEKNMLTIIRWEMGLRDG